MSTQTVEKMSHLSKQLCNAFHTIQQCYTASCLTILGVMKMSSSRLSSFAVFFLKSHPTRFGPDVRLQVSASTWAPDPITAEDRLVRALTRIRETLGEAPPEI